MGGRPMGGWGYAPPHVFAKQKKQKQKKTVNWKINEKHETVKKKPSLYIY